MQCVLCMGKGCALCRYTGKYIPKIAVERMRPLYTCYSGNNATLINQVSRLYLEPGMSIADVTYGVGAFWNKVDLSIYKFYPSDLKNGLDFRCLPYQDRSMDVVVLDPPYMHHVTKNTLRVNSTYNNHATTPNMTQDEIIHLYCEGIKEAQRIIKKSGRIWVKCQDSLEYDKQKYTHIELYAFAKVSGLYMRDMFVLHADSVTPVQGIQRHAKKNHSYLLIFENKERY